MKYVTFKRLTVKNFLSVGEENVEITFPTGLNIITGYNKDKADRRNGVGKSTIADAIFFSIYGITIRDIKKDNIPNNITSGKTEVSIEFDVKQDSIITEYKITRLLNPSKCFIYKNDVDITRDSINNTTKFVSDLISSSPEVFQNCVIMTINNTVPFMGKKKLDKRKFIEGILNLEMFSTMLTSCRTEYNEIQRDFNIECGKYEATSNQIQSIESQRNNQRSSVDKRKAELANRLSSNDSEIETLKKKSQISIDKSISEYNNIVNKYESALTTCNDKKDSLKNETYIINANINTLRVKLKSIETGTICPSCHQPISTHTHEKLTQEKVDVESNISSDINKLNDIEIRLQKAAAVEDTLRSNITKTQCIINEQAIKLKEKDGILSRLNQLEQWNKEIISDIEDTKTQIDTFDKMSDDLNSNLQQVQLDINKIKTKIALLDVVKFIVSEEGVKSYIVKKILQLLNSRLAYYLKQMDSNCVCVFNEYFEEQIIDDKGKVLSYFNFSGAEKKNIDLACLFAFMDIRRMQGDVAFNFNIYDELFDSSLDERGVELVIDILNERVDKYNECIMVISHRKESQKLATGEVIFLEKSNGVTTRVMNVSDI